MDFDFQSKVSFVTRTVTARQHDQHCLKAVVLSRTFPTPLKTLWCALTSAERLKQCFLPIQGDLHLGGRFQFEGNASGSILECVPLQRIALTWEFGEGMSMVELDFTKVSPNETRLVLSHLCPIDDHWKKFGPGATGIGWDMAMLGLDVYFLSGGERINENVFAAPEARKFIEAVSKDWERADIEAGEDENHAKTTAAATMAFYTGQA